MRGATMGVLALSLVFGSGPAFASSSQGAVSLSGTARKEAKRPYTDYIVRARQVDSGAIAASMPLDGGGNFMFTGMSPASYLMELVNGQGKVVCTAGPLAATAAMANIEIDCHRREPLAAWLLVGAAGAAGVTAAVVVSEPGSTSATAVTQSASPSR
jgi:hypothetical protein